MRVALVTGGTKGLGKSVVEHFLDKGLRVAFTYFSSEREAEEMTKKYGEERVLAIKADASDAVVAKQVVDECVLRFGRLDILVNNAFGAKDASVLHHDAEMMHYTMAHTFYPAYYYSIAVAKIMQAQKYGRIISVGSINGLRGREGSLAYASAKSALTGFTKTLAKELGIYNITCNVIAPGFINTDGQKHTSELIKKMVLEESAIKKLPSPDEIATLIYFLAAVDQGNITGEVIKIDCGQYI